MRVDPQGTSFTVHSTSVEDYGHNYYTMIGMRPLVSSLYEKICSSNNMLCSYNNILMFILISVEMLGHILIGVYRIRLGIGLIPPFINILRLNKKLIYLHLTSEINLSTSI